MLARVLRSTHTDPTFCPHQFHVLPKPIPRFAHTSFMFCPHQSHVLPTPVSCFAHTNPTFCPHQFHVLPRPISRFVHTSVSFCPDQSHVLPTPVSRFAQTNPKFCPHQCHVLSTPMSRFAQTNLTFCPHQSHVLSPHQSQFLPTPVSLFCPLRDRVVTKTSVSVGHITLIRNKAEESGVVYSGKELMSSWYDAAQLPGATGKGNNLNNLFLGLMGTSLVGFLTSLSSTGLYVGRVPRLTSDIFTCCHTRDRVGRP